MHDLRIAAFLLAGGEGSRLRPLTANLPKPALPFAGTCRIIDIALANLHNSGVSPVFVLLQYKPAPLLAHLREHWPEAIPLPPHNGYAGTADAVRQNLSMLERLDVDVVAVLAADHVCRLDLRTMAAFHRGHGAACTIAALPVPLHEARDFGVLVTDARGRVTDFQEKPTAPVASPRHPGCALVSMGNYLFSPAALTQALTRPGTALEHDFGHHVLPRLVREGEAFAYDFRDNRVPGVRTWEDAAYWRDVGTLRAYHAAEADTEGARPRFALDNAQWPIPRTLAPTAGQLAEAHRSVHVCAQATSSRHERS